MSRSASLWAPPRGELRDLGLRVRVLGDGPRTTVLLHGLAGSNRYFGAAYDALARDALLVVPDLLGFGGSPWPDDARYDMHDHVSAVLGVLERLGVRHDVRVVGHSAGALVALGMASLRPDLVRHVVAVSPPLYRSPAEARRRIVRTSLQVRLFASGGWASRQACRWMCRHRALAADLFAWLRRDVPEEVARDATRHTWTSYSGTLNHLILSADAEIPGVDVPVDLIAGREDPVLDPAWLAELAESAPNVTLELWPGAHDLPLTSAPRMVDSLTQRWTRSAAAHD